MPTPAEHAATIIAWLGTRSLSAITPAIDALRDGDVVLAAADAIADAADSDDEALRGAGLGALFGGLVEPLNDGFTPAGRAVYARIFGRIVWRVAARQPTLAAALARFGIVDEAALLAHHAAVRRGDGAPPADAKRIVILSRVTIGADVLLTSVALQRLRQRYANTELVVLGDGKLQGLFGGLPGVRVRPISYARRGPLRERLASWLGLLDALAAENADLVLAPDSRLDQLGLLPVTANPARYLLWENLQPEGAPVASLATVLDRWLAWRLAVPATPICLPRVALDAPVALLRARLAAAFGPGPLVAVKLDHGGNPAKALPRAGEIALLQKLRALGWRVLLDRGFGAEELANSDALLAALGWTAIDLDDSGKGLGLAVDGLAPGQLTNDTVLRFHGSIAGWAAALSCCTLALSYDSVGHHLAAALGVPVVVAFTGFSDPGFPIAWQPRGAGAVTVVPIATAAKHDAAQWERVAAAFPRP